MYELALSEHVSLSRTYMLGVYDPASPNEIRFEKVILPEAARNTINSAKQHYLLANIEEAETTRIMVCISIEEYLSATHRDLTEEKKEDIELTKQFSEKLTELKRIAWQILQIE